MLLKTIEEYHYALGEKESLQQKGVYELEMERARNLMAELYLKGMFNPSYNISDNPLYNIDEIREISKFIEDTYHTPEGKINWSIYHADYF